MANPPSTWSAAFVAAEGSRNNSDTPLSRQQLAERWNISVRRFAEALEIEHILLCLSLQSVCYWVEVLLNQVNLDGGTEITFKAALAHTHTQDGIKLLPEWRFNEVLANQCVSGECQLGREIVDIKSSVLT